MAPLTLGINLGILMEFKPYVLSRIGEQLSRLSCDSVNHEGTPTGPGMRLP